MASWTSHRGLRNARTTFAPWLRDSDPELVLVVRWVVVLASFGAGAVAAFVVVASIT